MSQQQLLGSVVEVLEALGIDYMITGAVASSMQGSPRATHDIDILVCLNEGDPVKMLEAFPPPEFYLSETSIHDAIKTGGTFNLLEPQSGLKVDFWILTDDRFDKSRFARKQAVEFHGMKLKVSAPEDTVLMKLKWAKMMGGSEKQFSDALNIYELQFDRLDLEYLSHWARELDIEALLKRVKEEATVL